MSEQDKLNFPGDFQCDFAFIINHLGETINITDNIVNLNIYESIRTPFITGDVTFIDSNNIVRDNELNLGQEFLVVKLRTPEMPVDIENIVDKQLTTNEIYLLLQPNHTFSHSFSPNTIRLNELSSKYTKLANQDSTYQDIRNYSTLSNALEITGEREGIMSMYVVAARQFHVSHHLLSLIHI